ncbi:hypothetical protein LTR62_008400 [Meristemomyces frigidus]|uniref:Mediator of RNA polymerase II transcription subunit 17 n=1 Tax=Meristemomyces frigidus TaxID=1508187 RepID=A0AAN7YH64_9PEZI|nr:hypothetical protein LTR62_008400 [Meristemomyces frigidus]
MATLSIRPWSCAPPDTNILKDNLGRVTYERGHFRDITEASLQEELASNGALERSDTEDEDDDDEEADKQDEPAIAKPSTREDLWKARAELLQHVDAATNDVAFAVDFVSLLLTKDAPKLAATSISPALKHAIPLGTLGIDIWHRMPEDKLREAQDALIATNVRMEALQQSADGLLAAAARLGENVRKETKYWEQILSLTEKGWNVCRLPGQRHRLGVTFGFGESAPEFSRRGIAALNSGKDGEIVLERGIGSRPKGLRVSVRRGGEVVGTSRLADVDSEDEVALETRIRRARDSLFDEELFHEMVRESRLQSDLGVGMQGDTICFSPGGAGSQGKMEVLFELVSLEEDWSTQEDAGDEGRLAQAVALASRLLLGQAHRDRLRKRADVPAPMSEHDEGDRPLLPILRPIMAFVMHRTAMHECNAYSERMTAMLADAKIEHDCERAVFNLPGLGEMAKVEPVIQALMQPWRSEAKITIGSASNTITAETTLAYGLGTNWSLLTCNEEMLRFSDFDELRGAADKYMANAVAGLLESKHSSASVRKGRGREALLAPREPKSLEKGGKVWVAVDSVAGTMTMSSRSKMVTWSIAGGGSDIGLGEAWEDLF